MIEDTRLARAPLVALPPGMLMWFGMYTALFYVCGGMIAAMYDRD
jgi:hypothetical protein